MRQGDSMAYQPGIVGRGYNQAVLRVEHRPRVAPHTREELEEILDILQKCGVDAWWYSVSAKGSFPLFPSKVLPYHEDLATDLYPWLVEEGHRRGIVMMSWEYLNTAPLVTEQHPDWRVRYLDDDSRTTPRDDHFVCFLSPYGELLKEYCVEVLEELGFDGIWFDGCYLFGTGGGRQRWTCCCERCAKAFRDATGLRIPQRIDWADPIFHSFVEWRYGFFEDYWASLASYVRQRSPEGLIVFNYFNRHYRGADSGSPMRRRSMDALVAGEGTSLTVQMQTKVQRAVSPNYPSEVWTNLHDGVKLGYPSRPDPDPAACIFYAQAAATAGGYASFGLGPHPRELKRSLSAMSEVLDPMAPFIGGDPARLCGLVFSGATKDCAHPAAPNHNKPAVDAVYGLGYLLDALHYPYEILLDNQLTLPELRPYAAVLLPDVQCMADEAAPELEAYVRDGGVLVATGQTGVKTPRGAPRERGVLDDLLGVSARFDELNHCVIEPQTDLLLRNGLPPRCMISGAARLVEVRDDVTVLATAVQTRHVSGAAMFSGKRGEPAPPLTGVAVCERKLGAGRVVLVAPNIGADYSQNPNRRSRELVRRVTGPLPLSFETDAPPNVVVSAWRQPGRLVLHLLNQPATMCRRVGLDIQLWPEDFTPTGPIALSVKGRADSVSSPHPGTRVHWTQRDDAVEVTLERLDQHAVVVLEDAQADV